MSSNRIAYLQLDTTSVVDYNLNALDALGQIRRNNKTSRGIELVNRYQAVKRAGMI